ncbi:hypothetical protein JCM8097_007034 [Rhodosporidiobolus ruineniae]
MPTSSSAASPKPSPGAAAAPTSAPLLPPGSTIRPAPVVPPSPSVPPTPSFSRPTSPRPPALGGAGSEPASPTRARAGSAGGGAGAGVGGVLGGTEGAQGGMLSQSASVVDLSHIFERDVEFAPSHLLAPSEAVDVAVPPVLTEAALALSLSSDGDPLAAHELAHLAHEAESDAQAGSGWSSPGGVGAGGLAALLAGGSPEQLKTQPGQGQGHAYQPVHSSPLHQGAPHALPHVHHPFSSSRSPTRGGGVQRSLSPDHHRRATSPPMSDSSASASAAASVTSGPTAATAASPPTSYSGGSPSPMELQLGGGGGGGSPKLSLPLGPFGQRLTEALEEEANRPGSGSASAAGERDTSPTGASETSSSGTGAAGRPGGKAATYTPLKPSLLLPFPSNLPGVGVGGLAPDDPFSSFSPSSGGSHLGSGSAVSSSPLHSPSYEAPNPFSSVGAGASPSAGGGGGELAAPHPRRLSFYSYADLINEERIQELKGEGIGPTSAAEGPLPSGAATPGGLSATGAGGGGREAGSRTVSGGSLGAALGGKKAAMEKEKEREREGDEQETLQARVAAVVLDE